MDQLVDTKQKDSKTMMATSDVGERIQKVLVSTLFVNLGADEIAAIQGDQREFGRHLDQVVGLDSLAILDFVAGLEREFGFRMDSYMLSLATLRDLEEVERYVTGKLASREPGEK